LRHQFWWRCLEWQRLMLWGCQNILTASSNYHFGYVVFCWS